MEVRKLRERKGVSYDEKALEAQQLGDFEFMDTDTETKQRRKGRSGLPSATFDIFRMTIDGTCKACIGPACS